MFTIRRCTTKGAFEAVPEGNKNLNLEKVKSKYETVADLPILIIIKYNNKQITCYKNGKLILRDCSKEESEEIAKKIYEDLK